MAESKNAKEETDKTHCTSECNDNPVSEEAEWVFLGKIGHKALSFAVDAAYATLGVAATFVDSTKDCYKTQRNKAQKNGDKDSLNYKVFVAIPDQLKLLGDDLNMQYRHLVDKGKGMFRLATDSKTSTSDEGSSTADIKIDNFNI